MTYGATPGPNHRIQMTQSLTLPAFAKINLSLHVLHRRADGYHDLNTIFQTISVHDTLKVERADDGTVEFSCDDRTLPLDESNLVVRAAEMLRQRFKVLQGARIRLEKRIPSQAGLGGGSSDAAITLVALTRLWDLNASAAELIEIGSQIGADVPFFFYGGTAQASGTGDQITARPDLNEILFLIIKPNANISTSEAYKALDERCLTRSDAKTMLSTSPTTSTFASLENDFEKVVFDLEPEIARAKAALVNVGAQAALLAGSGSAVFGIFETKDAQRRAIQAIELETGWRVFLCKTVGRNLYRNAMGEASELLTRFSV